MNQAKRKADEDLSQPSTKSAKTSTATNPSAPPASPAPTQAGAAAPASRRTGKRPETILDYLAELTSEDLNVLYQDPFTVMTVFRSLPPLAKQYVLRMLTLVNASIPRSHILGWSVGDKAPEGKAYNKEALDRLSCLRILQRSVPSAPIVAPFTDPTVTAVSSGLPSPTTTTTPTAALRRPNVTTSIDSLTAAAAAASGRPGPGASGPATASAAKPVEVGFCLNPHFQRCLQRAMCNLSLDSDENGLHGVHALPISTIDGYASKQWSQLLHWMVGIAADTALPSRAVMQRCCAMGLMGRARDHTDAANRLGLMANQTVTTTPGAKANAAQSLLLTPSGVAFLLKSRQSQVWEVILHYLDTLPQRSLSRSEALMFLFRLSFMSVGPGHLISDLTETQRTVLMDLKDMGLVYLPDTPTNGSDNGNGGGNGASDTAPEHLSPTSRQGLYYYPTRLVANLSTASRQYPSSSQRTPGAPTATAVAAATLSDPEAIATNERYVLTETTLKVYGFTSCPYQIALLSFFVDLKYRLPNMVVGFITRASIRRALLNNISVDAVIGWFEQHAHPRLVETALGKPDSTGKLIGGSDWVIPPNVTDQMKLWSAERSRLTGADAVMITDFADEGEFKGWYTFTLAHKSIYFADHEKQVLVVSKSGFAAIKAERQKQKEQEMGVQVQL